MSLSMNWYVLYWKRHWQKPETTKRELCSLTIEREMSFQHSRYATSSEEYAKSMACHIMDSTRFVILLRQDALSRCTAGCTENVDGTYRHPYNA